MADSRRSREECPTCTVNSAAGQWAWPAAEFTVQVGRSSRDLRLSATVQSG